MKERDWLPGEEHMVFLGILTDAIKWKQAVVVMYKGEQRVIEPHALGMNGKLRAWQTSSEEPGWRLFDTNKMTLATFEARPNYVQNDKQMPEGIVAQL